MDNDDKLKQAKLVSSFRYLMAFECLRYLRICEVGTHTQWALSVWRIGFSASFGRAMDVQAEDGGEPRSDCFEVPESGPSTSTARSADRS